MMANEENNSNLTTKLHIHRLVQDENAKAILLNVPTASTPFSSINAAKPPIKSETPSNSHSNKNPVRKKNVSKSHRARSASAGRNKESEFLSRHWALLFENLRRAIDDLYTTCEADDNVPAAREVVLVLENCVRDFRNLANWLRLKFEYDNTPPIKRPTSLAWEVRKTTTPAGKLRNHVFHHKILSGSSAKRHLDFDEIADESLFKNLDDDQNNSSDLVEPSNTEEDDILFNENLKNEDSSKNSNDSALPFENGDNESLSSNEVEFKDSNDSCKSSTPLNNTNSSNGNKSWADTVRGFPISDLENKTPEILNNNNYENGDKWKKVSHKTKHKANTIKNKQKNNENSLKKSFNEKYICNTKDLVESSVQCSINNDDDFILVKSKRNRSNYGLNALELESRYPGRAIQIHEKLSSPARKKEPHEAFKRHQEKQIQARLRREKFQDEKTTKLGALNNKIEEVIEQKEMLITVKRDMLIDKMKRAEEKRQQHIENIRKKAREEEAKLKEIAFINVLQAQNSRFDRLAHHQTVDEKHVERLAELAEERARKVEERASKEARAEERRRLLEEKRLKTMQELKERIRSREERIQEEQEQARKERMEAALEKARDREEKLLNVRAAEIDLKTELQEKILHKQQEAAKRHKEKLDKIRIKAFELSVQRCLTDDGVPKLKAYEPLKKCNICDVFINNEVQLQSHLRGKNHCQKMKEAHDGKNLSKTEIHDCNLKSIVDAKDNEPDPKIEVIKERNKSMKKRIRKIKVRMQKCANEFEKNLKDVPVPSTNIQSKVSSSLKDLENALNSKNNGAWDKNCVTIFERALGEINRSLERFKAKEQAIFYNLGGFKTLVKLFSITSNNATPCVPLKSLITGTKTWTLACKDNTTNNTRVFQQNLLSPIIDCLLNRLETLISKIDPDTIGSDSHYFLSDPVGSAIMLTLAQTFEEAVPVLEESNCTIDRCQSGDFPVRVQDQVGYIVNLGIVDLLAKYLKGIQDRIDTEPEVIEFLLASLNFMSSLAKVSHILGKSNNDPTNLLLAYQVTDLAGIVSMLYGVLLHQGSPHRGSETPPVIPSARISVVRAALKLLMYLFQQHVKMVQDVLGQEGISLEFRHIASYILWYCQHHKDEELLHLTIILVGYFAARHQENQSIIQSGHRPSILQSLCSLPFQYFSQPKLKRILIPTLIAICHDNEENKDILSEEISYDMLEKFMTTSEGRKNELIRIATNNINK